MGNDDFPRVVKMIEQFDAGRATEPATSGGEAAGEAGNPREALPEETPA
jgi:hypothetical protein